MAVIINHRFNNKDKIEHQLNSILFTNHNLIDVDKGGSTFNYKIPIHITNSIFQPIVDKFINMAGDDYYVIDFWANKYKNKGYVKPHNHYPNGPDIFFNEKAEQMKLKTGVYYFKKNSGNLIIEDKPIEIKEDDFIIFDSKLNHCSEPNNDAYPRIVFSINMGYKVKTEWNERGRKYKFLM
mgnify:CR=1 FL=1